MLTKGGNCNYVLCNYCVITENDLPGVYTVEEAVDKLGFGAFQVLISIFSGTIWVMYIHNYYVFW